MLHVRHTNCRQVHTRLAPHAHQPHGRAPHLVASTEVVGRRRAQRRLRQPRDSAGGPLTDRRVAAVADGVLRHAVSHGAAAQRDQGGAVVGDHAQSLGLLQADEGEEEADAAGSGEHDAPGSGQQVALWWHS